MVDNLTFINICETVFNSDNLFLHVLKAMLLKRQEPFLRHWLQNQTGLHTSKLLFIIVKSQSAWDVQSHSRQVKVLDFAPFRVREFELSHSKLANRIIKITHAHNLHVKMLVFRPFTIRTLKKNQILYYKIFSNDLKKSPRLHYNICN